MAVCAALVAGCGGVPGDEVATVDGASDIKKSDYDHWLGVAAKSSGTPGAVAPDPPDFKACIAAKRKALPAPGKGQAKTTDAQLKTQCKQEAKQLKTQVMQLLISYQWLQGEAADLGVKVTDAEVKKAFETQKQQSFPKDADYQKFLKQSGQSEADLRLNVKLGLLTKKIRDKVTKDAGTVTDKEVADYYAKNKARFAQPERRDLLVILTKTRAQAVKAKAAVQGGESFAKVAKRVSIDQASKAQGGKLASVAKGQQEKAFDTAIFSAEKGKLRGPVKTQFGYYVFQVTKITKASQQSQAQAETTIKQLLVSQGQQKALNDFVKKFQKKWKAKTDCAKAYETSDCKDGPKATPTPATQPGQGQQQQQAPQPAPTQ